MKFLYLFLAILLTMEPVVSVTDCWMNGQCRLVCKNDEDSVTRCSNHKRCCVPSRYLTIVPMTIDRMLPWTTPRGNKQVD
ncbi:beta-defensin 119 isoform X2 [Hippopotamus amphibius kiboko]|uniref:beta-defensin 119 isoform X2 n=1 Tax=Hippopotamus amphibius kiboko TaxID=575201 RepID=UPI0025983CCA|nr:beta-defensin 119 isoform X2 [Hippopotamus amphibius kiboko]